YCDSEVVPELLFVKILRNPCELKIQVCLVTLKCKAVISRATFDSTKMGEFFLQPVLQSGAYL
ncbi:hypothetical protein MAR_012760, partial [Mya arenaria]